MNEKAWLERYARALAKEQAERQAEQHEAGEAAVPGAGCSTVELIKREGVRGERRRVDSQWGQGWQIAEVERLLGLSRRDIQRACYEGQGGAGLVHPKESSWGKRSYGVEDLARLFQVKRQRDAGLSLPEVRRAFDAAEVAPGGWEGFEADQLARARDALELAAEDLAQARALHAATVDGGGESVTAALDAVIDGIFLQALAELRLEATASDSAGSADQPAMAARVERALQWYAACPARLGGLWAALEACRQRELDPSAPEVRAAMRAACATGNQDAGESAAGSRAQAAGAEAPGSAADAAPGAAVDSRLLAALFEAPGMELALELRLGPGGSDYARRALLRAAD